MSKQRYSNLVPFFVIGAICIVSILVTPTLRAQAALPVLQTTLTTTSTASATSTPTSTPDWAERPAGAAPDWPTRPATDTPTPTYTPTPRPSDNSGAIVFKVAFLSGAPLDASWRENLWTVVEWQDGLGNWHVIEGWQARLDRVTGNTGWKIWWVSPELYGRGPFTWVAYNDSSSDRPILVSPPFRLPSSAGVIVRSEVGLGKPVLLEPRERGSGATGPVTGGERDFVGLRASLTVFLIVLLVASLLFRGSRRRPE